MEPFKSKPQRRRHSRGFTLIELIVVVVIIGITAALATPTVITQIRERRSRDTAQQVALVYSTARMRAMGRGSAVMVRYDTGSFQVVESIEGTQAEGRSQDDCATAPGFGCLTTQWGNAANWRQVGALEPNAGVTVEAWRNSAKEDLVRVCFTPGGRSFVSLDGTNPTTPFAGSLEFRVQRGTTGLLRKVALLPNGNARLAL